MNGHKLMPVVAGCLALALSVRAAETTPDPGAAKKTPDISQCMAMKVLAAREIKGRIAKEPKLLLTLPLVYPGKEEEAKVPNGWFAQSAEMIAVTIALNDAAIVLDEETVLAFLEKIDWEKAPQVASIAWRRSELSPASRMKIAPRVEALFGGEVPEEILAGFFRNPATPRDAAEHALKHPKATPGLKKALEAHLKTEARRP